MTKTPLDQNDGLLLYGYGLFETLKVTSSGIELPNSHWLRMNRGGQILQLNVPTYQEWLKQIHSFIEQQKYEYPYAVRVTLSGGSSAHGIEPQLLFHAREIPYTLKDYEQGFSVVLLSTPRSEKSILTRIKSTNYIENILGREEARQAGAHEGLWINSEGYLSEGTITNVFFFKEGVLYTPSLDCGCLDGTRRTIILKLASERGVKVQEGRYKPSIIADSDQIFLTNSLLGIMPVSLIALKPKNIHSKILEKLIADYKKYVKKNTVGFDELDFIKV